MKKRILTLKQLRRTSACPDALQYFRREWGDFTYLSVGSAKRLLAVFEWDEIQLIAKQLLSKAIRDEYRNRLLLRELIYRETGAKLIREYLADPDQSNRNRRRYGDKEEKARIQKELQQVELLIQAYVEDKR